MTIYAIVNTLIGDKVIDNQQPVWTLVSPSGILQGGNPFFVPDFADTFEARCAIALRLGRLGKGISARFASRYIEAAAPSVLFVPPTLLQSLRSNGLPWTSALSYDRCIAMGSFKKMTLDEIESCKIGLHISNNSNESDTELTEIFDKTDIGAIVEHLSRDNTLKTGDIILAGITPTGPETLPGSSAHLSLNGEVSLKFNIR